MSAAMTSGRWAHFRVRDRLNRLRRPARGALAALALASAASATAESELPQSEFPEPEPNADAVFHRPAIAVAEGDIAFLLQRGETARALSRLDALTRTHPKAESLYFLKGAALLFSGDREGAVAAFETAWAMGDRQLEKLRGGADSIFDDPRIAAMIEGAQTAPDNPPPAQARNGLAPVAAATTRWDGERRRLVAEFQFPPDLESRPVMTGNGEIAQRLRRLVAEGKAAGLAGVLYDNRDRAHISLNRERFPQLTATSYGEAAKRAGVDYGLNAHILFERPTFGNSSTAIPGRDWRSQGRHALTTPFGVEQLETGYGANQIYLYPEHRDHDPAGAAGPDGTGLGDLYPANTPYMILSQGSSGSEREMLEAVAVILAALPPATRKALEENGLIAPAVQQIFRRGQAGISTEEEYLSPLAHPTVFARERLNPGRMIDLAQDMAADEIPPMVRLEVVSESRSVSPFGNGLSERLFTAPSAIARVHRTLKRARAMTVSAARTRDPNGRDLTFRWVLLRGDPEKVRIAPKGPRGATAEIEIDWHDRFKAGVGDGIETLRVDIGVFAHNGAQWSAPAFVSVAFPPRQRRIYNAAGNPAVVDHRDPAYKSRYADPRLFADRDWIDRFNYAPDGTPTGWVRTRGETWARFTRHGLKAIETDGRGRPLIAEFVDYPIDAAHPRGPTVLERASGARARYRYASDGDRVGEPVSIPKRRPKAEE